MVFIQGNAIAFMAQIEQDFADWQKAEGACEVERGVGEAGGSVVWVLDEAGVRLEDAGYEEGVVGVNCAAEAEGGVDPEVRYLLAYVVQERGEEWEKEEVNTSWQHSLCVYCD